MQSGVIRNGNRSEIGSEIWCEKIGSVNRSEIGSEIRSSSLGAGVDVAMLAVARPLAAVGGVHFTPWCRRSVKGHRSFAWRQACGGVATGTALHSGHSAPGKAGWGGDMRHMHGARTWLPASRIQAVQHRSQVTAVTPGQRSKVWVTRQWCDASRRLESD